MSLYLYGPAFVQPTKCGYTGNQLTKCICCGRSANASIAEPISIEDKRALILVFKYFQRDCTVLYHGNSSKYLKSFMRRILKSDSGIKDVETHEETADTAHNFDLEASLKEIEKVSALSSSSRHSDHEVTLSDSIKRFMQSNKRLFLK
jgi:hypothetical protein